MKKVFLHDVIGRGLRKEWFLKVDTPIEALKAIDANTDGKLAENLKSLADKEFEISILSIDGRERDVLESIESGEEVDEELFESIFISEDNLNKDTKNNEIHFMPALEGEGPLIPIIGAAIAKISLAKILFYVVGTMLIAGIANALFPPPKVTNRRRQTQSYMFDDRPNLMRQGGPVPVGYGMLRVGSNSAGFSRENKFIPGRKSAALIESYTTFNMRDIICEGPIAGLCDTWGNVFSKVDNSVEFGANNLLKSIFLNDLQIKNDQGELNIIPNEKGTAPIFSLGERGSGGFYKVEHELQNASSPLIGPNPPEGSMKLPRSFSDVNRSEFSQGAVPFAFSVRDRNVGALSLSFSSESMFHNWTDTRVRRGIFSQRVKSESGTARVKIDIGLRIFDGQKYIAAIDPAKDGEYNLLEALEAGGSGPDANFKIEHMISGDQKKKQVPFGDTNESEELQLLITYFAYSIFDDPRSVTHVKSIGAANDVLGRYKVVQNIDQGDSWMPLHDAVFVHVDTEEEKTALQIRELDGVERVEYYLKDTHKMLDDTMSMNVIFRIINSGQDFVRKIRNCLNTKIARNSNICPDFLKSIDSSEPNIGLDYLMKKYFDERMRLDPVDASLIVGESIADKKTSVFAEVFASVYASIVSSPGFSDEEIFANNYHSIMSLIKHRTCKPIVHSQNKDFTLCADGNLYHASQAMWVRATGIDVISKDEFVRMSPADAAEYRLKENAPERNVKRGWAFLLPASTTVAYRNQEKNIVSFMRGAYYKLREPEYITDDEYNLLSEAEKTRTIELFDPGGAIATDVKDQLDRNASFKRLPAFRHEESTITFAGISTSPATIDYNILLPYIGEGEASTIQLQRYTSEVRDVNSLSTTGMRMSLTAAREHKMAAGNKIKFNSPGTAWVEMNFDSVNFRQIPERNFLAKLKKVAVPENYNPLTRKYLGPWSGLMKGEDRMGSGSYWRIPESSLEWTDNPAWILMDMLMNQRFGLGKHGFTEKEIDIWNLYSVAKFCDELVETGFPLERPVRKFVTANSNSGQKTGVIAQEKSYVERVGYGDFNSISDESFIIMILNSAGEPLDMGEFLDEFNMGSMKTNSSQQENYSSKGRSVAFYMSDGSLERRFIKAVGVSPSDGTSNADLYPTLELYGPSFVDHPETQRRTKSEFRSEYKEEKISYIIGSSSSDNIPVTTGKCVLEASYPMVEPRFSMNVYFTEQEEALDVIKEITSTFRTTLNYINGQISFASEKEVKPSLMFTDANVSDKGFTYAGSQKTARTTVCKVRFNDRFDNFKSKVEYYEDAEGIEKFGYREQEIVGLGCTSRGQAQRLARFMVISPMLETEVVSFETGMEGALLLPGTIIDVSDSRRFGDNINGRVKNSNPDAGQITLDKILSNLNFYDPMSGLDIDRVEFCAMVSMGFEIAGNPYDVEGKASGLYKKMKDLASDKSNVGAAEQDELISGTKRSQLMYFDGIISGNKRVLSSTKRKFPFHVLPNSNLIISENHGLNEGDQIKFLSFGSLPKFLEGGAEVSLGTDQKYYVRSSSSSDTVSSSFHISKEENGDIINFTDRGFVTPKESISGGEHFYTVQGDKGAEVDSKSIKKVIPGTVWSIRGYKKEIDKITGSVEDIVTEFVESTLGASSVSNKRFTFHNTRFGSFQVAHFDYSNQVMTLTQSGGLGKMHLFVNTDEQWSDNPAISKNFKLDAVPMSEGAPILLLSQSLGWVLMPKENEIITVQQKGTSSSMVNLKRARDDQDVFLITNEKAQLESISLRLGDGYFNWAVTSKQTATAGEFDNYIKLSSPIVSQVSQSEIDLFSSGVSAASVVDGSLETVVKNNTALVGISDINDFKNIGRRQYRVTSVTEEESGKYQVKASEYNSGKFKIIENALNLSRPSLPIPPQVKMEIPIAPQNLIVETTLRS